MNKGIQMATGDVIGFLNSDDTFFNSDVLLSIFHQFASNPNLDIVYGDINYIDHSGKIKRKWRTGERTSFAKGWHPAHPGFYASKELFDNYGGFDENLRIAADFDLMLRFIEVANTNTKYLPLVCVDMKLGGESNKNISNIIQASKEFRKSFNKYQIEVGRSYIIRRWLNKLLQNF